MCGSDENTRTALISRPKFWRGSVTATLSEYQRSSASLQTRAGEDLITDIEVAVKLKIAVAQDGSTLQYTSTKKAFDFRLDGGRQKWTNGWHGKRSLGAGSSGLVVQE